MAVVTILEEQDLIFNETQNAGGPAQWCATEVVPSFVSETEYIVNWQGTEYTVKAEAADAFGDGAVAVGNLALVGGQGTSDAPFIFIAGGGAAFAYTMLAGTYTVAIYQGEEEPNGIVVKDPLGRSITYGEYGKILVNRADGSKTLYSEGEAIDSVDVELDFSDGDMTVDSGQGRFMKSVAINKPETLLSENIIRGVTIAGIEGECIGSGKEKFVTLDLSDGNQEVFPDEGVLISKAIIEKPETLIPGNIAEGVNIAGIVGTLAAGSNAMISEQWFTPSAATTSYTITHNLGVVPDLVIVFYCEAASTAYGMFWYGRKTGSPFKGYTNLLIYGSGTKVAMNHKTEYIESTTAGLPINNANESTVTINSYSSASGKINNKQYYALCIGGLT